MNVDFGDLLCIQKPRFPVIEGDRDSISGLPVAGIRPRHGTSENGAVAQIDHDQDLAAGCGRFTETGGFSQCASMKSDEESENSCEAHDVVPERWHGTDVGWRTSLRGVGAGYERDVGQNT
ncbi:MAG TPA: hypothetical protein DFR83_04180 [Deltaproteobacteria bacterium]|nr:hypothetical protein [Deltaproteobacteria bacterium]